MIRSTLPRVALATTMLMGSTSLAMADTVISFFTANDPQGVEYATALADAFSASHPGVTFDIEVGPNNAERDNMVKSRLATGTMTDVFVYNGGSLFQALAPTKTLVDLTNEPWQDEILDSFKPTVTAPDGTVRGAPFGMAMGSGILYNKPLYEELGLDVPMTWDEFMANNEVIKESGKATPVVQTFKATWTSQLFVLSDFYNVLAAEPDFPERYTNNEAKYATSPAALEGFQHQQDVFEAGFLNEDYASATFEDGMLRVANGEAAHYPMLTFGIGFLGQAAPELVNNVGFFATPGNDPEKNGMTTGMPTAIYINAASPNIEIAKEFVAFVASKEGACDIQAATIPVSGPFLTKGCDIPDDAATAVKDMQVYFDAEGRSAPALEFLSPIKGPNLQNITVEVGSGMRTALEGAQMYDEDVKKQALQLGLENW